MSNLDAQVRESQTQVAEAQSKIAELTSRIETARAKLQARDALQDRLGKRRWYLLLCQVRQHAARTRALCVD